MEAAVSLLFWPAVGLAVILGIAGLAAARPGLLGAAALLSLPASLYLAATPRFEWIALGLPLLPAAAALALHRRRAVPAALLLALFAGFFGWLFVEVFHGA